MTVTDRTDASDAEFRARFDRFGIFDEERVTAVDVDALDAARAAATPQRIQRKRTKGWRMPEGAVYVGRPTRWGNPTAVVQVGPSWECVSSELRWRCDDRAGAIRQAVNWFGYAIREGREGHPTPAEIRAELAGRDLACWCPLDQPCHVDVLLAIANGDAS